MKTPSIPAVPVRPGGDFDAAVKEVIEVLKGRRPNVRPIAKLAATATSDEIIAKANEIIDRIQS